MLSGFFLDEADPAIRAATEAAANRFRAAGAQVELAPTPEVSNICRATYLGSNSLGAALFALDHVLAARAPARHSA